MTLEQDKRITVALADPRTLVRSGLGWLIKQGSDLHVIAEAASGHDAVRIAEHLAPDVIILAQMLPGPGVPEVVRRISRRTRTACVVLADKTDDRDVVAALRAGAYGYVLEKGPADDLLEAVRDAADGRRYLSPPLNLNAIEHYASHFHEPIPDPYADLSEREIDVMSLMAEGLDGDEIASRLELSSRTVEHHRSTMMNKMGFRSSGDLVRYAVERGIIRLRDERRTDT